MASQELNPFKAGFEHYGSPCRKYHSGGFQVSWALVGSVWVLTYATFLSETVTQVICVILIQ